MTGGVCEVVVAADVFEWLTGETVEAAVEPVEAAVAELAPAKTVKAAAKAAPCGWCGCLVSGMVEWEAHYDGRCIGARDRDHAEFMRAHARGDYTRAFR